MITVRATSIGYYGHTRRKVGEVFEIKSMKEFGKSWMKKVDKDAESEVEENKGRDPAAISDGAGKATHEGNAQDPKKAGAEADKAAEEKKSEGDDAPPPDDGKSETTTGDEDVI